MKPIDANDAAFPSFPKEFGLTKREYIAALAMQGLLANPSEGQLRVEVQAYRAVQAADALLRTLEELK